ncbi:MAG TPA: antitoxin HicB [Lachnospiraceae bacterium]|nr:antitoxin HicB [Lachnospiraceae bacterium]
MVYKVNFLWDEDAAVWVATSDDVPGLVLESGSFDALVEKVRMAVPELLELNGIAPDGIRLSYFTEREDRVAAYG